MLASINRCSIGVFKSAGSIVQKVLKGNMEEAFLSKPCNMECVANQFRQNMRLEDPKDLDFILHHDLVPANFFLGDVDVTVNQANRRRHLLFAKDQQLALLRKAKCWYMDATFKVVTHPFSIRCYHSMPLCISGAA